MLEIMKMILEHVLIAVYQPFGFALIVSVLLMCLFLFVKEQGWKTVLQKWVGEFKTNLIFRKFFVLAFYTSMILFRTLLNRESWTNPFEDVIGMWWIYDETGKLITECLENLVLFIPFIILVFWCFDEKFLGKKKYLFYTLWKSIQIVFLCSMVIELLQLLLRLGTFQLSDLFYNTLGGLMGGILYWIGCKLMKKESRDEEKRHE